MLQRPAARQEAHRAAAQQGSRYMPLQWIEAWEVARRREWCPPHPGAHSLADPSPAGTRAPAGCQARAAGLRRPRCAEAAWSRSASAPPATAASGPAHPPASDHTACPQQTVAAHAPLPPLISLPVPLQQSQISRVKLPRKIAEMKPDGARALERVRVSEGVRGRRDEGAQTCATPHLALAADELQHVLGGPGVAAGGRELLPHHPRHAAVRIQQQLPLRGRQWRGWGDPVKASRLHGQPP